MEEFLIEHGPEVVGVLYASVPLLAGYLVFCALRLSFQKKQLEHQKERLAFEKNRMRFQESQAALERTRLELQRDCLKSGLLPPGFRREAPEE